MVSSLSSMKISSITCIPSVETIHHILTSMAVDKIKQHGQTKQVCLINKSSQIIRCSIPENKDSCRMDMDMTWSDLDDDAKKLVTW